MIETIIIMMMVYHFMNISYMPGSVLGILV